MTISNSRIARWLRNSSICSWPASAVPGITAETPNQPNSRVNKNHSYISGVQMKLISNRKLLAASSMLSIALLASCSSKSKESAARADAKSEPAAAIQVSTAPVVERSTNRGVEVVGSLEAQDQVTVSSQGSGNLELISVDLGSPVSRGQVIARIDQRELKLKRDQAEAALHQAEAKLGITRDGKIDPQKQPDVRQAVAGLERARYDLTAAKKLFDAGTISNQQYDVYQKTVEQAEARYQASLENVRNLEGII